MLNERTRKEAARWYPLKPVAQQIQLMNDARRFIVVPAGRRSGKTERAKRKVAKAAMLNPGERYFCAAPTREQAKRIYWADMKLLCYSSLSPRMPSESELIIYLANGAEVHIIGLDKPSRMEGILWSGGVVDEIADVKPDAWALNIRPALDTERPDRPGYAAWCWLIGVPEGFNHFYELAEYAQNSGDPDWGYYHWVSAEVVSAEKVDQARRQMSMIQFNQEYNARFETASGRIYADYSKANHTLETIRPHEQLIWAHDFNYTPLSSCIGVRRRAPTDTRDQIYILDEIVLESAVARQSALEFVQKFANHANKKVQIYGDPAGRAGEKHGQQSNYTEIEKVLVAHGWKFQRLVTDAAPAIVDRQNALRAKIQNAAGERSLFVNPRTAKMTDKGLKSTQLKKGSTFIEEVADHQHITTAVGYWIERDYPTHIGAAQRTNLKG